MTLFKVKMTHCLECNKSSEGHLSHCSRCESDNLNLYFKKVSWRPQEKNIIIEWRHKPTQNSKANNFDYRRKMKRTHISGKSKK